MIPPIARTHQYIIHIEIITETRISKRGYTHSCISSITEYSELLYVLTSVESNKAGILSKWYRSNLQAQKLIMRSFQAFQDRHE